MTPLFRTRSMLLIGLAILLSAGCSPSREESPPGAHLPGESYNVVFILVDTLRPDHLGCYGYDSPNSPNIDRLAKNGLLFEHAYSASTFTGEAVSALFTGRPPAMNATGLGWTSRPTPQAENLPKRFQEAGYATGIFSTSFVMRFRGFYDSFQESELFAAEENTSILDERLTDAALDFAKRHRNLPSFQYLHYYAPHAPYNPPAEALTSFAIDRSIVDPLDEIHPAALVGQGMPASDPRLAELKKHYDAEIAFIDGSIGRYLAGLEELGLREKTIVVLLSDHGEEFMEHGFADHAWNLYEETLRIPLIISAPGLLAPQRVTENVSICDVMPTLLRLTHQSHAPYTNPVSGQYLVEPGESAWTYAPRRGPIYASLFPESRAQLHAVLFDDYKYIAGPRWLDSEACRQFWLLQGSMATAAKQADFLPMSPWAPREREALFNLATDPGEKKNILETAPDVAERGRALLHEYEKASAPYREESSATTMDDPFGGDFVPEALRALGEDAVAPDGVGDGKSRISPEVIESLETMGYL